MIFAQRLLSARARRVSLLALVLLAFPPVLSLVSAIPVSTQAMPWDSPLQQIQADLQGPVALVIGTILIVGAGLGLALTHQQGAFKLLWIVVGLGISLNAAKFLSMIAGSGSGYDLPRTMAMLGHVAAQATTWIH